jgi:hypothetical protein
LSLNLFTNGKDGTERTARINGMSKHQNRVKTENREIKGDLASSLATLGRDYVCGWQNYDKRFLKCF